MRVVFGWEERGEKIGGARLFFPSGPPKLYHPKLGEKTQGKTCHSFSDKIALSQHQRSTLCLLSLLSFSWICLVLSFVSSFFLLLPLIFILFSPFSYYLSFGTLPFFSFFFRDMSVIMFCFSSFFFFFFFKDSDFFFYKWFLFLIHLGDYFFFWVTFFF